MNDTNCEHARAHTIDNNTLINKRGYLVQWYCANVKGGREEVDDLGWARERVCNDVHGSAYPVVLEGACPDVLKGTCEGVCEGIREGACQGCGGCECVAR